MVNNSSDRTLSNQIPEEVISGFFSEPTISVSELTSGKMHSTYSVEFSHGRYIIQRVHFDVVDASADDYAIIYHHLSQKGWVLPKQLKNKSSEYYQLDHGGTRWRVYTQLANHEPTNEGAALGAILGKLHTDLSSLDHHPLTGAKPRLTSDIRADLETELPRLESAEAQNLAEQLLSLADNNHDLPDGPSQLIHGDPKVANILFDSAGMPYTFVDWDVDLQNHKPWFDIGDMQRSITVNAIRAGQEPSLDQIRGIISGYYAINTQGRKSLNDFSCDAIRSAQHLCLQLAMRYLADWRDGQKGYFAWDSAKYPSRHAHNLARVQELLKSHDIIGRTYEH